MSEMLINAAEQKLLDFFNKKRPESSLLCILPEYQQKAVDSFSVVPKDQSLLLVPGKNTVTYWGYFMKSESESVIDAVTKKISNSGILSYSQNTSFTNCGICIRGYKSGNTFVSIILHSDTPVVQDSTLELEDEPPRKQNEKGQGKQQGKQQGKNKGKNQGKNQNKQYKGKNKKQQKNSNKNYFIPPNAFIIPTVKETPDNEEQTPEHVQEKIMRILNDFLASHEKSALQFSKPIYDQLDAYHQECVEKNMQISRSWILSTIVGYQRRCIQIMNIKDPKLINNNFVQTFFSSDFNSEQFQEPINAIAVSFKYNKENTGSLIVFCAFDQHLPAPEKWANTYLTVSTKQFHPKAELTISEKLKNIRTTRTEDLAKMINDIRINEGLPEIPLDKEGLSRAAMDFVIKIGRNQNTHLPFNMTYVNGLDVTDAKCLTACSPINTANYLEKIFDDFVESDETGIIKGDWTRMAINFYDHASSRAVYAVVFFAK